MAATPEDNNAFFTVVPHVRDPLNSSFLSTACSGTWRVNYNGDWITVQTNNTRVRDGDNRMWLEICQGHVIEVDDDYPFDCQAYSNLLGGCCNRFIEIKRDGGQPVNTVFGEFLSFSNGIYGFGLAYRVEDELRLYARMAETFDFPVDSLPDLDAGRVSLNVDESFVMHADDIQYDITPATQTVAMTALPWMRPKALTRDLTSTSYITSEYYSDGLTQTEFPFKLVSANFFYVEGVPHYSLYDGTNLYVYDAQHSLKQSHPVSARWCVMASNFSQTFVVEVHDLHATITEVSL